MPLLGNTQFINSSIDFVNLQNSNGNFTHFIQTIVWKKLKHFYSIARAYLLFFDYEYIAKGLIIAYMRFVHHLGLVLIQKDVFDENYHQMQMIKFDQGF